MAEQMDITYVAGLARLELTAEETAQFGSQLGAVLDHMAALQQLDVTGIEPTAHAVPRFNVLRQDAARPSLPRELALANAPAQSGGLFSMPKVVE